MAGLPIPATSLPQVCSDRHSSCFLNLILLHVCCSFQDLQITTRKGGKVLLDGVSGVVDGGLCAVMVRLYVP